MNITVDQTALDPSIAVMRLQGSIDASNYENIIEEARSLHQRGVRALLIDMGAVGFMASSGLVALHSAVMIMQDQQPPDLTAGWSAFHELANARESGMQHQVKLLNPQPKVQRALEMTGMTAFFEVHTDETQALASFPTA